MVTVSFDNAPDGILLIRKVCATNPSVTLQNAEFKVMSLGGQAYRPSDIGEKGFANSQSLNRNRSGNQR